MQLLVIARYAHPRATQSTHAYDYHRRGCLTMMTSWLHTRMAADRSRAALTRSAYVYARAPSGLLMLYAPRRWPLALLYGSHTCTRPLQSYVHAAPLRPVRSRPAAKHMSIVISRAGRSNAALLTAGRRRSRRWRKLLASSKSYGRAAVREPTRG
jgi:hypothetical protein